jgi:hypothetical protein
MEARMTVMVPQEREQDVADGPVVVTAVNGGTALSAFWTSRPRAPAGTTSGPVGAILGVGQGEVHG